MFALTIDQHRSRTGEDLVPALLDGLAPVPTVLPFERGRKGGKEFYSQVTLSLIGLHDTVWLPRARGEAVMTASADI